MAERKERAQATFRPAGDLLTLYNTSFRRGLSSEEQLVYLGEFRDWLKDVDRSSLEKWLLRTWARTQTQNNDWAEQRFQELRGERADWSVDGMIVDENGDPVGASVWSTYNSFRSSAQLMFAMPDLIQTVLRTESLVYPLSPKFESVLFWKASEDGRVKAIIAREFPEFDVEEYPVADSFEGTERQIRMSRVKRGKLGTATFAKDGVLLGKIGYWESTRLQLGDLGMGIFVRRVRFPESQLLPNGAYISPLEPEKVKAKGGRPMEEKYPDVTIVRVDANEADIDFIAASLKAASPDPNYPVVLSYTTPRIWLGEMPKHGPGRSGLEPTISHL